MATSIESHATMTLQRSKIGYHLSLSDSLRLEIPNCVLQTKIVSDLQANRCVEIACVQVTCQYDAVTSSFALHSCDKCSANGPLKIVKGSSRATLPVGSLHGSRCQMKCHIAVACYEDRTWHGSIPTSLT